MRDTLIPIKDLQRLTAFEPLSSIAKTGPEVINEIRFLYNKNYKTLEKNYKIVCSMQNWRIQFIKEKQQDSVSLSNSLVCSICFPFYL